MDIGKIELSPSTVEKLQQDKIQLRVENERYLRSHPEVKAILEYFLKETLLHKPTELDHFAVGNDDLTKDILSDAQLREKVEAWAATKQK